MQRNVKELVSKSEFARRAKVNPSTVSRLCRSVLAKAVDGKRIDVMQKDAAAYLEDKAIKNGDAPAPGFDPLYSSAVAFCRLNKTYTARSLRDGFNIGNDRAKKIIEIMQINGMIPEPGEPAPIPPAPVAKRAYVTKNTIKKQEALAALTTPTPSDSMIYDIPEDIRAFADMTLRELIARHGTSIAFLDWLKATKAIEDINEKRLKNAQTKGELVSRYAVKVGIIDPIDAAHIKLLTDGAKTIARRVVAMHDAGRPLDDVEKFVKDQITSFIRPIKAKVARALKNV